MRPRGLVPLLALSTCLTAAYSCTGGTPDAPDVADTGTPGTDAADVAADVATDATGDGSSDAQAADVVSDVPVDAPTCDGTFTLDPGSADGHADPLAVQAGQARAGRLQLAQIPADDTGLALVAPGDFVLANSRIAMLIEDAGPSDLYDEWGGRPVGLARLEGGALVEPANFNEVFLAFGRFVLETTSVTVLQDGSNGGPAVVRTIGTFKPIPFIDEFGRNLASTDYTGLEAAMDYELAPDSDHVDVYYTVTVNFRLQ